MKKLITIILILALALPAAALADPDYNPVGRWTIADKYNDIPNGYMFPKTDFFIFDDGTVYRVSITKKNHENELTLAYDNGIWVGDRSDMTIKTGKDTFKAYIDDNGFLFVIKDGSDPIRFMRVKYEEE
jgi:hypothetical protein